jgi:hypothetical protein
MNIDDEIENIISNIKENEYDSLNDIEELRTLAIDKVFSNFMRYENNIQNKIIAEKELQTFEFIDVNDLQKGDFIRYFNLRFFFDLKLVIGGTVLNTNFNDSGDILILAPYGVKRIKPNIFFKRIKTDDLFKMKLIQIANSV